MSGAHSHHHHGPKQGEESSVSRIRLAFVLNFIFAIVELVGGWWTGSVAITADAIHDFGDSVSLGLAWYLEKRAQGGPTVRFSYGLKRLSLLSALVTGVVLISGSLVIGVEAVRRLITGGVAPDSPGMIGLAILGLAVNGFAAWRLLRGRTHNEKMLSWHLIEDVLGWFAVLVGGVCIYLFQWNWLDPIMAVAIAGFISWNACRNLMATILVFLQQVPANVDSSSLRGKIASLRGVSGVHDFHVWSLDGDQHVASMHLVIADVSLWSSLKHEVRHICSHFGIVHATIECETPQDDCGENCDPH